MERPNKTLRQHRAVLSARQGDEQSPACGTFYAHRQRLAAELARSLTEHGMPRADQQSRVQLSLMNPDGMTRHSRSPAAIENDLRMVDGEIALLEERIHEIDRLLAASERPGYY
jgi:hypothetical protein